MDYLEKKDIPLFLIRYKEIIDSYFGKCLLFTLKKDRKKLFIKFDINFESKFKLQLFLKEILIVYKKINKRFFFLPKFFSKSNKVISFFIEYHLDNNLSQKILKEKAKNSLLKFKFLVKLEKFYKEMLKELHKHNFIYFFFHLENIIKIEKSFKIKWFPFFFNKKFNFTDMLILSPRLVSKIKEKNNKIKNFENDFFFQDDFDILYFLILKLLDLSGFNNYYKIKKNEISINIEYINSLEELNSSLKEKSFFHSKSILKPKKPQNWKFKTNLKKKTLKSPKNINIKLWPERFLTSFEKIFPLKKNILNIYKKKALYNGEDFRYKKNHIGTLDFFHGDFYIGNFKDKKINKKGLYIFKNNDLYKGEFKNNFLHGYGEYYFSNKNIYKGFWKKNKPNGNGIFFDEKIKMIFKGVWKQGKKEGEFIIFDIFKQIFFKSFFEYDEILEDGFLLIDNDRAVKAFLQDFKKKNYFLRIFEEILEELKWGREEEEEIRQDFCFIRNFETFAID